MKRQLLRLCVMSLAATALSGALLADTVITLRKTFIDNFNDKALLSATITPAHLSKIKTPGQGSNDGDVHISATPDATIGLPMVAEIANAKLHKPLVTTITDAAANQQPIQVTGVWRLWCEHGGDNSFEQGQPVDTPENSNPDHVFEMHPLTKVGSEGLANTFQPITGYTYKDPLDAFSHFENAPSEISEQPCTDGGDCVSIRTRMVGYNYTAFLIKMESDGADLVNDAFDSTWVFSAVYDLSGDKVVGGHSESGAGKGKRKMVFVKGTPPHDLMATLKKGDVVKVVGIPRINLTLVKWRLDHQNDRPGVLRWSLPYEMIILSAKKSAVAID
jgi:hypothetical protein